MQKQKINQKRKKIADLQVKPTRQSQGITLIALVVTIVVLLILAGVSILVLFGDNGTIKQAGESSLQTKLSEIEEKANVIHADLDSQRYATGNTNKKVTMGEIVKELQNQKYAIEERAVGENVIEAIELEPKTIKMGKTDTASIKVNLKKNEEGMAYYAKVEDKYYKISLKNGHITLEKTNGKTQEELPKNENTGNEEKTITAKSNNENIVTVKAINQNERTIEIQSKENLGSAEITVNYGEVEPQRCTVTVAIQPITGVEPNPNTSITTEFGKIDVIWLDKNNNIIQEPEKPILQSKANPAEGEKVKMTPVKWNGTGATATLVDSNVDETNAEITKDDGTKEKAWYDYEQNRWANARTENGSYFVWIPRYAYRITYYKSETDNTITGYYDGYGMWSADTITVKYTLEEGIETVEAEDGNLYIVHPAFGSSNKKTNETDADYSARKTQNINNGGWGETLTGFWFAKFEVSKDKDNLLASVPGVDGECNKTIGEFYTMGRTATYGQTGVVDTETTDEIVEASFMNSHMVKNSEWGAVAYLTHSKYGRNGEELTINMTFDTGGSNSTTAYLSNQNQSTTANPYGIYDMYGGVWEYTATFNNTDSNRYLINKKWTENTKLTTNSSSTKYATKYENSSTTSNGHTIYIVSKTGDAIKEVYRSDSYSWLKDYSNAAYSNYPFFYRGGDKNSRPLGGVFASHFTIGGVSEYNGLRTVLAP